MASRFELESPTEYYVGIDLRMYKLPSAGNIPLTLLKYAHWVRTHITEAELKSAQLPRVIAGGRRPAIKPDSWFARPDLLQRALKLGATEMGSRSKVFQWLGKPNPHYGGRTPLDLLESTNGEQVIQFMEAWANTKNGPPTP